MVKWVHDRSCGRAEATAADGTASAATVMERLGAAVQAVGEFDQSPPFEKVRSIHTAQQARRLGLW